MGNDKTPSRPGFREALLFWLKLGCISFGGPTGQIAIMHAELVEKRRWIAEGRFLHALNFCMLLPGPEAQQLATYLGWLLHRAWGGVVAGALFVLPSAFLLWILSYVYVVHGEVPWIAAIFSGLQPAVVAIVAAAVLKVGHRALKNRVMWAIATAAFVGIYFFNVPFVFIILAAGLFGWVGGVLRRKEFLIVRAHGSEGVADEEGHEALDQVGWGHFLRTLAFWLLLWWAPVLAAGIAWGWDGTLFQQGLFFGKAALVTFGGAYAVLPYVAQQAVEHYGWLSAGQMIAGLGLAETTPGPLIMVLQFVGFVGAWQHPGGLPPLAAATLGAAITTWTTFVPSFLFIFLGAPHIERLRRMDLLSAALSAITAAVVGVVLNLAVWFGLQVLFPDEGRPDVVALVVAGICFAGLWRLGWGVMPVVLASGVAGLVRMMLFGAV